MPEIKYIIGDATDPITKPAVICHVPVFQPVPKKKARNP